MSDDLRTVGRFASVAEAAIARNALEAAGIPAAVADELTLTADPLLGGAINYIKVQVREIDVERAEAVLAEQPDPIPPELAEQPGDEPPEGDDDGPDEFPPETPGVRRVRYAYRAALMGLIVCVLPVAHLYSLVLLLQAAASGEEWPPAVNRHFYIALILDLVVIGTFGLVLMQFVQM